MSNRVKITDKRGQAYKPAPTIGQSERMKDVIDRTDMPAMEEYVADARKERRHAWAAMVAYAMPDEKLRDAISSDGNVHHEPSDVLQVSVGCLICDLFFKPGLVGTLCAGHRVN